MISYSISNNVVGEISPDIHASFNDDVSLNQTVAILLYPRINPISFNFFCDGWSSSSSDITISDVIGLINDYENRDLDYAVIHVPRQCMSSISDSLGETYKSYHRIIDVEKWLRSAMNCLIFQSEQERRVIIITTRFSYGQHHFIQALFPRLFPWYFKDKPLIPEEIAYLKTLTGDDGNLVIAALNERVEKLNLRAVALKQEMIQYMKSRRESEIRKRESTMETTRNRIADLMTKLEAASKDLEKAIKEYSIIENETFSTDEAERVVDILTRSKDIRPMACQNGRLIFRIRGLLLNYPEIWEAVEQNRSSMLYEPYRTSLTVADRVKLCHALFVDEILQIKLYATFSLELKGHGVSIDNNNTTNDDFTANCIENPHLMYYTCLGSYASKIQQYLIDRNMEGAIAQCAASVSSVNLAETPVIRQFLSSLFGTDKRCIYNNNGEAMTPTEAIAWIDKHEN